MKETNNKIISFLIFISINLFSILIYLYGSFNSIDDFYYLKFSEFLYLFNFVLLFFLLKFFLIEVISPQGLMLISMIIFSMGRVFLNFFNMGGDNYELLWGVFYYLDLKSFYFSLIFWHISISTFILGSVLLNSKKQYNVSFTENNIVFDLIFKITTPILIILFFPVSYDLISNFSILGYEGLYQKQADYDFGLGRIAALLLPINLASAFLLKNKSTKISIIILLLYILSNIVVGQRAMLFVWSLIVIWLLKVFFDIKLSKVFILTSAIFMILLSQFVEMVRSGLDFNFENNFFVKFISVQSLTYMLPSMVLSLNTNWPIYSKLTMFLPVGGILSFLGIVQGKQEISTNAFFAYSLNSDLFNKGFGLGWSFFLDLYLLANQNLFILGIFSFIFGLLFSLLIEKSKTNRFILYLLLSSLPAIIFSPRSILFSVFSSLIYAALLFLICAFLTSFFKRKSNG